MQKCANQLKGVGSENWKIYVDCVEGTIKEAEDFIAKIESLKS